jgi:hypothetical protein
MLDIILSGTPKSWQNEMDKQGFDAHQNPITDVIAFMERLEAAELFEAQSEKPKAKSKDKQKGKNNRNSSNQGNGDGEYVCLYHGRNSSHNTDQCHLIKNLVTQKKTKTSDSNERKPSVTWKDKTDKSKKDLAAFMKKAFDMGVKQGRDGKKRKASNDLNALDKELAEFNYDELSKELDAELDDLKISSDDSVSSTESGEIHC